MTTAITAAFLLGLIGYALAVSGGRAASGEPPRATGESSPQNPEPLVDWQAVAQRRLAMAHRYELQRNQLRKMLRSMRRAERRRWAPVVDYAIRLASAVYAVPASEMWAVARCESTLYPFAKNGRYKGYWQLGWRPFGFSPYDPVASALSTAQTVKHDGSWRQWQCKP